MRKSPHTMLTIFLCGLIIPAAQQHGYQASGQTQERRDNGESTTKPDADLPQLTLQLGHSAMVNAVAFSSDGRFVLTGSPAGLTDNSIVLWVTATGREVRRFHPEEGAKSIVFLPNSYLFITEIEDGKPILWDAETGRIIRKFEETPKFSPDGQLLLTSSGQDVIIWKAATGKAIRKLRAPQNVSDVSFSPDGHDAVIEISNSEVRLWDLEKNTKVGRLTGSGPKFSADGKLVVTTLGKETILWNAATHLELRRFPGVSPEISADGRFLTTDDSKQIALWDLVSNRLLRHFAGNSAQISPDNRLVVTRESAERVIWNALTGKELYRFHSAVDGVTDIRFSTDGRFFLTEGHDNKGTMPKLWDAVRIREIRELPSFDSTSAVFSPDNRLVLTGDRDKFARLWDAATGLEVRRFEGLAANTSWIDFPADGRFLQINSVHQSGGIVDSIAAHLWNLSSGQEVRRFEGIPDMANSADISPDGRLAVTGGENTAHLWNIGTAAEIRSFVGHTDQITSVRFSPNGRLLATGSEDGTARLWDVSTGQQLRILVGHSDKVSAVRFSHDGRFILTGSADGTVRLWSATTGKEARRYGEHAAGVFSLISSIAFSSDDRYVLSGCLETSDLFETKKVEISHFARLWEASTGREVKRFKHQEPVTSVAFSPDGRSVLTASLDATARVWNIGTGENVKSLKKKAAVGLFADYSPDGRFILTGGVELGSPEGGAAVGSRAFLWNATTFEEVRSFASGSPNDVMPLFATLNAAFSADGRFLITQGMKMNSLESEEAEEDSDSAESGERTGQALAQVWDVKTGKELGRFGRDNGDPEAIKFSPDTNSILLTRQNRSSLDVLDALTGKVTNVITDAARTINDMTYSPDGRLIAGASEEGTTYLWDAQTRKLVHRFQDDASGSSGWSSSIGSVAFMVGGLYGIIFVDGKVFMAETSSGNSVDLFEFLSQRSSSRPDPNLKPTCIAFSPVEELFSLGGQDGTVHLIFGQDLKGKQLRGHTDAITSLAFSRSGHAFGSASVDKTVRLWDVSTRKQVQLLQHLNPVSALVFSDDDHFVLTASGGSAWLWDTATGNQIRQLKDPSGVSAISFVGNGRIVTGSEDGTLRMWDQASGAELRMFKGHTGRINSLAITADNKFLVSGSADKTVRLWDVTKPVEIRRFEGHTDAVTAIAISPDGSNLMTGSADQTARLWDVEKGTEVRRIEKRFGSVASVTFSHDGRFLLTGSVRMAGSSDTGEPSFSGVARLWDTKTMKLIGSFGTKPVVYAALSSDGKYILTASGARSAGGLTGIGDVQIWEVASGKNVKDLEFEGYVRSVAFSPDGQSILTGTPFVDPREDPTVATAYSQGNEAVLVRVGQDADEGRKFLGHSFPVSKVAFSPDSRFIVTGSLDGTSAFWDLATHKQVVRLIPLRDSNWVVVDKEGRFDTNNLEEIKGLQWVFSDDPMKPLLLEIYMRDYYEPRLLPSLLNGKVFEKVRPLGSLNRVQPVVKITKVERRKVDPESDVTVTVDVANASGEQLRDGKRIMLQSGVFDLRLFRDGQLVGYVPGNLKLDNNGNATVLFPVKLPRDRPDERVEFTAYAFNADRVKSVAAGYSYQPRQPRPPTKGRAYVISVGVNAYEDQSLDLGFAARDALLSQQMLTKALSATGVYSEVISITLASDYLKGPNGRTLTEKLATKRNFRALLDALAHGLAKADPAVIRQIPGAEKLRKVKPEDLVLLSFSSHGYTDREGKFYLIPYDTGNAVEFIPGGAISPSSLSHFISSDELSQWVREIDAGELALIVDTCHSAAAVEAEGFKPGPMGSRGMGQLAYDKGMRILAASQADDVALELDRLQQGLLTYALMEEGLNKKKADKNRDGRITLDEWLGYGAERVPTLYDDVKAGRVEELKRKDLRMTAVVAGPSVKKNVFQQPQLFDFKRKRREVVVSSAGSVGKE
jgi:WD40 repeat protein/uncharacterized caspase-like protein